MFILPAFNQTIQRLAGPGLGHNTRHVYVGDGIGDVVRPLISAGVKAAARLAAKGLAAARNLGVDLFHAAKPLAMRAATEAAEVGKDVLRQRAPDLFAPRVRTATHGPLKPSERQRATIQQRAQYLLVPRSGATRRAGPRKQPRATIQQKARQLLSAKKHDEIRVLANSKLNAIADHVSTALKNGEISDQEFRLVLDELAKYYGMRGEIRAGARKAHATVALDTATKNELLQRGRTEARLSFMRKLQDGP